MGVRLTVEGLLLAVEHRAGDDGGPGFISAAVLPDGSRETLELWAFGDNLAGHELLRRADKDGPGCPIVVVVELRAKQNKAGTSAILSTGLKAAFTPDGELVEGRQAPEFTRGAPADEPF